MRHQKQVQSWMLTFTFCIHNWSAKKSLLFICHVSIASIIHNSQSDYDSEPVQEDQYKFAGTENNTKILRINLKWGKMCTLRVKLTIQIVLFENKAEANLLAGAACVESRPTARSMRRHNTGALMCSMTSLFSSDLSWRCSRAAVFFCLSV